MYASLINFELNTPDSIEQTLRILAEQGANTRILAGGCDMLPDLRRRRSRPQIVLSLAGIPNFDGVSMEKDLLKIEPLASLRDVECKAEVKTHFQALYEGIHSIASIQVKTTGTLIGNLCVATPASDIAPPLMVLGAELRIQKAGSERIIPVEQLFAGAKKHSLAPDELVTEVRVPLSKPNSGSAFAKLTRTNADIAKVNVAIFVSVEKGCCTEARIALGAIAPTPVRASKAESILVGHRLDEKVIEQAATIATENIKPITDLRSTADYRKRAIKVLIVRLLNLAYVRACGGAS